MAFTRREFLAGSGALVGGLALSSLGIDLSPVLAYAEEMKKIDRVKSARQTTSICCYCAVGCGLIASTDTKTGKIINIEGDPEHPISEGSLCAKGAGSYQTQLPMSTVYKGALSCTEKRQMADQELGLGHHRDREKDQKDPRHCHQIQPASGQANVGNIDSPNMIWVISGNAPQQIREDLMLWGRFTCIRTWSNACDPHGTHIGLHGWTRNLKFGSQDRRDAA